MKLPKPSRSSKHLDASLIRTLIQGIPEKPSPQKPLSFSYIQPHSEQGTFAKPKHDTTLRALIERIEILKIRHLSLHFIILNPTVDNPLTTTQDVMYRRRLALEKLDEKQGNTTFNRSALTRIDSTVLQALPTWDHPNSSFRLFKESLSL